MIRIFPHSRRGTGRVLCSVIVIAVALSGCASLEKVVEKRYQKYNRGESYRSSVQVWERRGGLTLVSAVRMPGKNPERVGIGDLAPLREETTSWGTLALMAPKQTLEEVSEIFGNELDTRYIGLFEQTIAERLRDMEVLKEKQIVLRVLLATDRHGYLFIDEQPIKEELVALTVGSISPDDDNAMWWFDLTGIAAHELTHVNHFLTSDQFRTENTVNLETAAGIVEQCARLFLLKNGGKLDSAELAFQGQPMTSAFPGLEQGEFNPIMKRLDFIKGNSTKGSVLGTAALRTLTHDGVVDFNDSDQMSAIAEYCKHVSNTVPDFVAGKMR